MKAIGVLSAVLLAAVVAPGAAAAAASDSNMPQQLASCLYKRYPARVQSLLGAARLPDANREYGRLTGDNGCADDVMGDKEFSLEEFVIPLHLMRGALAEEALRKLAGQAGALPALPIQRQYMRPWFVATNRNRAVDEMAACVADTDPAGIVALLQTRPGGFDEGAAIAGLKPSLGRCLAANAKLEADARPVRAALADALYQRVQNPALSVAQAAETPR